MNHFRKKKKKAHKWHTTLERRERSCRVWAQPRQTCPPWINCLDKTGLDRSGGHKQGWLIIALILEQPDFVKANR